MVSEGTLLSRGEPTTLAHFGNDIIVLGRCELLELSLVGKSGPRGNHNDRKIVRRMSSKSAVGEIKGRDEKKPSVVWSRHGRQDTLRGAVFLDLRKPHLGKPTGQTLICRKDRRTGGVRLVAGIAMLLPRPAG